MSNNTLAWLTKYFTDRQIDEKKKYYEYTAKEGNYSNSSFLKNKASS